MSKHYFKVGTLFSLCLVNLKTEQTSAIAAQHKQKAEMAT